MRRFLLRIVILCAILLPISLYGNDNAAAFMDIKVGARATAMGNAYTAVVSDASAVYWNYAALSRVNRIQILNSVLNYNIGDGSSLQNINGGHYFFALAVPIRNVGTFGFGWKRFSISEIEIRQDENTVLGTFDDAENAFFISWGNELVPDNLSIGFGLRIIQQKFAGIQGADASGVGIGLGVLFHIIDPLTLGLCVEDDFNLKWQNGITDKVPFKSRVGFAYSILQNNLTITADLEQKRNWPLWGCLGVEYRLVPAFLQTSNQNSFGGLALRAGLADVFLENRYSNINFQQNNNWSGGFGLFWKESKWQLHIDYAYGMEQLGTRHRFTFSIGL